MATNYDIRTLGFTTRAASTTKDNLTVDPNRKYWVHNPGRDSAGAADTNVIIVAVDNAATMDCSAENGKIILGPGATALVPRGHNPIYYASLAGTPRLCVAEDDSDFGRNH